MPIQIQRPKKRGDIFALPKKQHNSVYKKMQKYPYQWKILIKKHVVPNKMFVSESGISD